jgi:hypothetical protein
VLLSSKDFTRLLISSKNGAIEEIAVSSSFIISVRELHS